MQKGLSVKLTRSLCTSRIRVNIYTLVHKYQNTARFVRKLIFDVDYRKNNYFIFFKFKGPHFVFTKDNDPRHIMWLIKI